MKYWAEEREDKTILAQCEFQNDNEVHGHVSNLCSGESWLKNCQRGFIGKGNKSFTGE